MKVIYGRKKRPRIYPNSTCGTPDRQILSRLHSCHLSGSPRLIDLQNPQVSCSYGVSNLPTSQKKESERGEGLFNPTRSKGPPETSAEHDCNSSSCFSCGSASLREWMCRNSPNSFEELKINSALSLGSSGYFVGREQEECDGYSSVSLPDNICYGCRDSLNRKNCDYLIRNEQRTFTKLDERYEGARQHDGMCRQNPSSTLNTPQYISTRNKQDTYTKLKENCEDTTLSNGMYRQNDNSLLNNFQHVGSTRIERGTYTKLDESYGSTTLGDMVCKQTDNSSFNNLQCDGSAKSEESTYAKLGERYEDVSLSDTMCRHDNDLRNLVSDGDDIVHKPIDESNRHQKLKVDCEVQTDFTFDPELDIREGPSCPVVRNDKCVHYMNKGKECYRICTDNDLKGMFPPEVLNKIREEPNDNRYSRNSNEDHVNAFIQGTLRPQYISRVPDGPFPPLAWERIDDYEQIKIVSLPGSEYRIHSIQRDNYQLPWKIPVKQATETEVNIHSLNTKMEHRKEDHGENSESTRKKPQPSDSAPNYEPLDDKFEDISVINVDLIEDEIKSKAVARCKKPIFPVYDNFM